MDNNAVNILAPNNTAPAELYDDQELTGLGVMPMYLSAVDAEMFSEEDDDSFSCSALTSVATSRQSVSFRGKFNRSVNGLRRSLGHARGARSLFSAVSGRKDIRGLSAKWAVDLILTIVRNQIKQLSRDFEKISPSQAASANLKSQLGKLYVEILKIRYKGASGEEAEQYIENVSEYLERIRAFSWPHAGLGFDTSEIKSGRREKTDKGDGASGSSGSSDVPGTGRGEPADDIISLLAYFYGILRSMIFNMRFEDYMEKNDDGYYELSPEFFKLQKKALKIICVLGNLFKSISLQSDIMKLVDQVMTEIPLVEDSKHETKAAFLKIFAGLTVLLQKMMAAVLKLINDKNTAIYNKRLKEAEEEDDDKSWFEKNVAEPVEEWVAPGEADMKAGKVAMYEARDYLQAMDHNLEMVQQFLADIIAMFADSMIGNKELDAANKAFLTSLLSFKKAIAKIHDKIQEKLEEIEEVIEKLEKAEKRRKNGGLWGSVVEAVDHFGNGEWVEGFDDLGDFLSIEAWDQTFNEINDLFDEFYCGWIIDIIQFAIISIPKGVYRSIPYLLDYIGKGIAYIYQGVFWFAAACGGMVMGLGSVVVSLFSSEGGETCFNATESYLDNVMQPIEDWDDKFSRAIDEHGVKSAWNWAFGHLTAIPVIGGLFDLYYNPYADLGDLMDYLEDIDVVALMEEYRGAITEAQNVKRFVLSGMAHKRDLVETVRSKMTDLPPLPSDSDLLRHANEALMGVTTLAVDATINAAVSEINMINGFKQIVDAFSAASRAADLALLSKACQIGTLVCFGLGFVFPVAWIVMAGLAIAGQLIQAASDYEQTQIDEYHAPEPELADDHSDVEGGVGSAVLDVINGLEAEAKANMAAATDNGLIDETDDGLYQFNGLDFAAIELRQTALDNAMRMIFSLQKHMSDLKDIVDATMSGTSKSNTSSGYLSSALESLLAQRQMVLQAIKFAWIQYVQALNIAARGEIAAKKIEEKMGTIIVFSLVGLAVSFIPGLNIAWYAAMAMFMTLGGLWHDYADLRWGENSAVDITYDPDSKELREMLTKQGDDSVDAQIAEAENEAYLDLLNNGITESGNGFWAVDFGLVAELQQRLQQIYTIKEILLNARHLNFQLKSIVKQEFSGISLGDNNKSAYQAINNANFNTAMQVLSSIVTTLQQVAAVKTKARAAERALYRAGWSLAVGGVFCGTGLAGGPIGGLTGNLMTALSVGLTGIITSIINMTGHIGEANNGLGDYNHFHPEDHVEKAGRSNNEATIDEKLAALEYEIYCAMNTGLIGNIGMGHQAVSPMAEALNARMTALYYIKEALAMARQAVSEIKATTKRALSGKSMPVADFGLDAISRQKQSALAILGTLQQGLEVIASRKNQINQANKGIVTSAFTLTIQVAMQTLSLVAVGMDAKLQQQEKNLKNPTLDEAKKFNELKAKTERQIHALQATGNMLNTCIPLVSIIVETAYDSDADAKSGKADKPTAGAGLDARPAGDSGYLGLLSAADKTESALAYSTAVAAIKDELANLLAQRGERFTANIVAICNGVMETVKAEVKYQKAKDNNDINDFVIDPEKRARLKKAAAAKLAAIRALSPDEIEAALKKLGISEKEFAQHKQALQSIVDAYKKKDEAINTLKKKIAANKAEIKKLTKERRELNRELKRLKQAAAADPKLKAKQVNVLASQLTLMDAALKRRLDKNEDYKTELNDLQSQVNKDKAKATKEIAWLKKQIKELEGKREKINNEIKSQEAKNQKAIDKGEQAQQLSKRLEAHTKNIDTLTKIKNAINGKVVNMYLGVRIEMAKNDIAITDQEAKHGKIDSKEYTKFLKITTSNKSLEEKATKLVAHLNITRTQAEHIVAAMQQNPTPQAASQALVAYAEIVEENMKNPNPKAMHVLTQAVDEMPPEIIASALTEIAKDQVKLNKVKTALAINNPQKLAQVVSPEQAKQVKAPKIEQLKESAIELSKEINLLEAVERSLPEALPTFVRKKILREIIGKKKAIQQRKNAIKQEILEMTRVERGDKFTEEAAESLLAEIESQGKQRADSQLRSVTSEQQVTDFLNNVAGYEPKDIENIQRAVKIVNGKIDDPALASIAHEMYKSDPEMTVKVLKFLLQVEPEKTKKIVVGVESFSKVNAEKIAKELKLIRNDPVPAQSTAEPAVPAAPSMPQPSTNLPASTALFEAINKKIEEMTRELTEIKSNQQFKQIEKDVKPLDKQIGELEKTLGKSKVPATLEAEIQALRETIKVKREQIAKLVKDVRENLPNKLKLIQEQINGRNGLKAQSRAHKATLDTIRAEIKGIEKDMANGTKTQEQGNKLIESKVDQAKEVVREIELLQKAVQVKQQQIVDVKHRISEIKQQIQHLNQELKGAVAALGEKVAELTKKDKEEKKDKKTNKTKSLDVSSINVDDINVDDNQFRVNPTLNGGASNNHESQGNYLSYKAQADQFKADEKFVESGATTGHII